MTIAVKESSGKEKTYTCSRLENVNGELFIYGVGDVIKTYGSGEWISYREVK